LALAVALLFFIPFLVLLQLAFNSPQSIVGGNTIWRVPSFTLANIAEAWTRSNLLNALKNSAIITLGSVSLNVFASSSAAYQIARFPTKFSRGFYMTLIFSMAIPAIVTTVPLYLIMRGIGAINTLWGMILLNTTGLLPFATFLMTSFIEAMPRDMEEAAMIDGCTRFTSFFKVVLPLLRPAVITVILLNTVSVWNEYGRSVFFLQKSKMFTVPLATSTFIQKYSAEWELLAAGAFIGLIPAVIVFLLFQKQYINGLTAGAVKG
jgi:raffinose/stachyose/melibiose transport system permease protein